MTGETLPPSETPAGIEQIDGTEYEYPYRIEDCDGRVVADDLDRIPPLLNQEEMDVLAAELEMKLARGETDPLSAEVLASVVRKLPDSEFGRGELPDDCEVESV